MIFNIDSALPGDNKNIVKCFLDGGIARIFLGKKDNQI